LREGNRDGFWNRLASARDRTTDDVIATYKYDSMNRRVSKAVGEVATDYLYNERWQCVEERRGELIYAQYVWDETYIDSPAVRFCDLNADGDFADANEVLYYCYDANRCVTALVNADGDVVERYTYDPYGKPTFHAADWSLQQVAGHADGTASAFANEILYCGYRYDPETGLYHVRNRYYHPILGRWITRDPKEDVDGMNLYQYVRSAPTGFVDWNGAQASRPATDTAPAEYGTIEAAVAAYAAAKTTEGQINTSVKAANEIFAKCCIKLDLKKYEDLNKNPDIEQLGAALQGKTAEEIFALLALLGNAIAKQHSANIGVIALDTNLAWGDAVGFSVSDPKKSTYDKDKKIRTVETGGFIGDIVIFTRTMTVLTLAQEVRDRLAHEDVDAEGAKLRHGVTADLIKAQPKAQLSTLADDECDKLRAGLKRLKIINEDPVQGRWYTVTLYVGSLTMTVKQQPPTTSTAPTAR